MKSKYFFVITTVFSLFSIPFVAVAGMINLGAASDYNAFIHQDFSATSSDIEGRLAVGGVLSISNYSVNIKHGAQLYADTDLYPAVVTGGDLIYSSGQIAGNVYVGGNYTPISSASITNGTVTDSGPSPIDFDIEFQNLNNLSLNLSLIGANSSANVEYSTQKLVGSGQNGVGSDLHVFSLDASDMELTDYLLSQVDKDDTVLLNISGKDITTSSGNFGGSNLSLANMSDNILFNFYEAENLTINAALFGTILAPKANISAPWGVIWGQVIANSWVGNTQINDSPFVSNIPELERLPAISKDVPEPYSVIILGLALLTLTLRRNAKLSI
jgi:choice-of-anchor A domain-containing protein